MSEKQPSACERNGLYHINLLLAVRLASIVVHADEFTGPTGHDFDRVALRALVVDPLVSEWIKSLGPLAPEKRVKP